MTALYAAQHTALSIALAVVRRVRALVADRGDRGQSTVEYALLLLGAATIALIVVTWASGTGKIGELFDSVIDSILGDI